MSEPARLPLVLHNAEPVDGQHFYQDRFGRAHVLEDGAWRPVGNQGLLGGESLFGIPVVTSPYVPEGQFLLFSDKAVLSMRIAPPRPTRWRRFRRWLRTLPHRICPC